MDIDLRSKKVHFGNGVGPNKNRTLSLVSSTVQMHFLLTKRLFGKGRGKYEQKQTGK